jgi:hypothetical protein
LAANSNSNSQIDTDSNFDPTNSVKSQPGQAIELDSSQKGTLSDSSATRPDTGFVTSALKFGKNEFIKNSKKTDLLYASLCSKIGVDLASHGRLEINLSAVDKLPEALYLLNLNNHAMTTSPSSMSIANSSGDTNNNSSTNNTQSAGPMHKSVSNHQLTASNSDSCFVYLTVSVDSVSMTDLMKKTICKEHWPTVEFALFKSNSLMVSAQMLGLHVTENFLINKNEVVVQKLTVQGPVSSIDHTPDIRQFDIINSVNGIKVSDHDLYIYLKQERKKLFMLGMNFSKHYYKLLIFNKPWTACCVCFH